MKAYHVRLVHKDGEPQTGVVQGEDLLSAIGAYIEQVRPKGEGYAVLADAEEIHVRRLPAALAQAWAGRRNPVHPMDAEPDDGISRDEIDFGR